MKKPLTKYELRIVAAMFLLRDAHPGPLARLEIGIKAAGGRWTGVQLRSMRRLEAHGLAKPCEPALADAVERGDCTCGCDRWELTEQGIGFANRLNIRDFSEQPFGGKQ